MNEQFQFTPMFAAGGIEVIVFLVIAGISALVNWLQNRGKEGKDDWTKESTPRSQGAPSKTKDWEEELRRMLEGDQPAPPVAQPPPVIRQSPPPAPPVRPRTITTPTPPSVPTVQVPQTFSVKEYKAHCDNCGGHIDFPSNMMGDTIYCPHCFHPTTLEPYMDTRVEQIQHKTELTSFKESASAHQRVTQLDQLVAHRMENAHKHRIAAPTATRKAVSAETREVVGMFRNTQTARQAVIASIILAPPKALES